MSLIFIKIYVNEKSSKKYKISKIIKFQKIKIEIITHWAILFNIKYFVFINFNTFSFKLVLQNNFSHSTLLNCGEILSRCFNISLGVVRSLPWGPRGRAVKTLAANAGGRGFEPHRGQNLLNTIYSIL